MYLDAEIFMLERAGMSHDDDVSIALSYIVFQGVE
jgi:hypothetical protein